MNEKILIYDIETATNNDGVDAEKNILKVFGCYSYITQKYYCLTDIEQIQNIIKKHTYFIGFNNFKYDNIVLANTQGLKNLFYVNNEYKEAKIKGKINIDLQKIIIKRKGSMKTNKGMLEELLMEYSLDYITKTLDLVNKSTSKIKEFDYSILNKESWTNEEWQYIKEYTIRDLEITKKLYDWLEDYFSSFKDFVPQSNIEKKEYLTSNVSDYVYTFICHKLGLKPEYNQNTQHVDYGGGYVAYPAGEEFHGDIYCMDFNSLYPSIYHQCNLFSPCNDNGWNGGIFKVIGIYSDKEKGVIEKLIQELYELRLKYKKEKDAREYTIKIVINTLYGLTGNASYKHLYNPTTAADCTRLGRQWVKLARNMFHDAGYEIIYTDTDSVYLIDPFHNKEKMLNVKNDIINLIKANVPFPYEYFDMGVDDEISDMFFFKGNTTVERIGDKYMDELDFLNKSKGFLKKNYIYITKDNKVKYKNLGMKKKSTTLLSRKIFREYLIPKIIEERQVKFPKSYFINIVNELLENDYKLIAKRFNLGNPLSYKDEGNLNRQMALKYGTGIKFLIKNKRIGVGKGVKYCSIEEFKQANLGFNDLDLSTLWSELEYFIKNSTINLNEWF